VENYTLAYPYMYLRSIIVLSAYAALTLCGCGPATPVGPGVGETSPAMVEWPLAKGNEWVYEMWIIIDGQDPYLRATLTLRVVEDSIYKGQTLYQFGGDYLDIPLNVTRWTRPSGYKMFMRTDVSSSEYPWPTVVFEDGREQTMIVTTSSGELDTALYRVHKIDSTLSLPFGDVSASYRSTIVPKIGRAVTITYATGIGPVLLRYQEKELRLRRYTLNE